MSWFIDNNGVIYTGRKQPCGYFDKNGDVYDKTNITPDGAPSGYPIGFIDISGDAYDKTKQNIGFADVDGTIYNSGHFVIAYVGKNGQVYNTGGNVIGSVNIAIHQTVHKSQWRPMIYRAAAAKLLLLNE